MDREKISIVIPSYEPDENLINLCEKLIKNNLTNILIVNDGSDDKYNKVFLNIENKYNIKVLHHKENKGKGRALKTAFEFLLKNSDENFIGCVTADSDGQHKPEDIKLCIEKLKSNKDSLILGIRDFDMDNVPIRSVIGNKITNKVFRYLSGLKISDTQTGLRAIPKDYMEKLLHIEGERFEFETNMLLESKGVLNILEVPIETVYHSKTDHQSHFNTFSDSIKVIKILLSYLIKYTISAATSLLLDLVLFYIFTKILVSRFPESYLFISTVIARLISATYNYLVNYKFVFKSNNKHSESLLRYVALASFIMIVSGGLLTFIAPEINLISDVSVKFIVDAFLFILSYYIQKKYIF